MSESTTPAQCRDEDWNLARDCGLMGETQGTNAWDAALGRFAETLRAARAQQLQGGVVKLDDIEQYRLQMAAIGTAAIGYWKEGDSIHPDYDTVPLRDVAKLYAKYDELFKAAHTAPSAGGETAQAVVYPPDGTVSPFTVINLGGGHVQMGDCIHDQRLPALWFGKDGKGLGHEEVLNREAKEGETIAVVTFANVDGLDVLLDVVHRIRRESFADATTAASTSPEPFQARVQPWMLECFGAEIAADQQERNHRFLEEALELVQACGATASEAHQLVDYVYGRPVGDKHQEAGGVMVTLAALCLAQGLDMHAAGETELARIWTKVEQIRAKQAAKPKHSPLPQLQETPVPREHTQIIARAVAAHGRKWPKQLTSGVMFYEGERITRAEFNAEVRA